MTRSEKHNPLHPVCAIFVKYKDGTEKRYEFGAHALKMQAMMNMRWDEIETCEGVPLG